MEYSEEDFLQLSGIQHFSFCRRQWALIHIEKQWNENVLTVEGEIMHEKAHDNTFTEKRGSIVISRGMPVFSRTLGISGECDIVELKKSANGVKIFGREGLFSPSPVEYKHGKPKENHADLLQLCAQAMCLEEMLLCHIEEAFLFYGETNRRLKVPLTEDLRQEVKSMLKEMHDLFKRNYTPKVKPTNACKSCSLKDICLPKLCKNISAVAYLNERLSEADE
ncbi:MAG: CRISPR-associated protein Cas4 [Oscillospiraceae bacterium]